MLLAEPGHTPYDLHFSVLGFPVRVHPLFWLMGLFFGFNTDQPIMVLIAVFVAFVSILIHELGHALMMRRFGGESHIVLYMMGGLAIEGSGSSFGSFRSRGSRSTYEQVLICAAGPGAGFVLAAIVVAVLYAAGGSIRWDFLEGFFPIPHARLGKNLGEGLQNLNLRVLLDLVLWFNLVWGAVNLLPVFPLDGGQICQALMVAQDPWGGLRRSLWISVVTGAIAAVAGGLLFRANGIFMVLMFGSLAYSSYLALQQVSGGGRGRPW